MHCTVVFGCVASIVDIPLPSFEFKLLLCLKALEPMKVHVNCFGLLSLEAVIVEPIHSGVVSDNGSVDMGLGLSQLSEDYFSINASLALTNDYPS